MLYIIRRYLIKDMIIILRLFGVREHIISSRLHNCAHYIQGTISVVMATLLGWLLAYNLFGETDIAFKVASCLATVGYHFRITMWVCDKNLVQSIINEERTK